MAFRPYRLSGWRRAADGTVTASSASPTGRHRRRIRSAIAIADAFDLRDRRASKLAIAEIRSPPGLCTIAASQSRRRASTTMRRKRRPASTLGPAGRVAVPHSLSPILDSRRHRQPARCDCPGGMLHPGPDVVRFRYRLTGNHLPDVGPDPGFPAHSGHPRPQ